MGGELEGRWLRTPFPEESPTNRPDICVYGPQIAADCHSGSFEWTRDSQSERGARERCVRDRRDGLSQAFDSPAWPRAGIDHGFSFLAEDGSDHPALTGPFYRGCEDRKRENEASEFAPVHLAGEIR